MNRGSRIPFAGGLSGLLAALALPPFHLWPLVFVALVPLAVALGRPGHPATRGDAVWAGLAYGAVFHLLLLHWVPLTVHGMTPAGALSGALAVVILAGVGGIQGLALHRLLRRRAVSPIVALPLVWGGAELALAWAGPLAVPWLPLGLALAAAPELAGPAEWVGPRGLTLWIAGVNGGVAAAYRATVGTHVREAVEGGRSGVRGRRLVPLLGGAVALVLLPAAWGLVRAERIPMEPLPSILVGQMEIPRELLLDPERRDRVADDALLAITERFAGVAPAPAPAFVLLPEAPFASPWGPEIERRVTSLASAVGAPVLAGAHRIGEDGGRRNALLAVGPDGSVRTLHATRRLVPGVERPGLASGPGGDVADVGGIDFGVLICFEAAFDPDARRMRRSGAELLLNPSNDGWFRPSGQGWLPAAALAQHRAHLILRAIETRTGAVRASVGGELLVVAPTGRVLVSRPPGGEGLVPVRPLTSRETTLFVRFGDAGVLAVLLILAGGAVVGASSRFVGNQSDEGFDEGE